MMAFIIRNLFGKKRKAKLEKQRATFKMMLEFKQKTEYFYNSITKAMSDPETFLKCRDTYKTMLMNYRRTWLQKISQSHWNREELKLKLVDLFESYIIMLNDMINEGFVLKEASGEILENHKTELIKAFVKTFEHNLPSPEQMPEKNQDVDTRMNFFNARFESGIIFSFDDSVRASLNPFSRQLCKVVSVSKTEDSWGSLTFECNGKNHLAHIDDISGVLVYWQLSQLI